MADAQPDPTFITRGGAWNTDADPDGDMSRLSFRVDEAIEESLQQLVDEGVYVDKTELIRDGIRRVISNPSPEPEVKVAYGSLNNRHSVRLTPRLNSGLNAITGSPPFGSPSAAVRTGVARVIRSYTGVVDRQEVQQ